jgi:hypothetical protein
MESVYHIVTIRVNETSWAHVWRLRFCYLGMGYDRSVHVSVADGTVASSKCSLELGLEATPGNGGFPRHRENGEGDMAQPGNCSPKLRQRRTGGGASAPNGDAMGAIEDGRRQTRGTGCFTRVWASIYNPRTGGKAARGSERPMAVRFKASRLKGAGYREGEAGASSLDGGNGRGGDVALLEVLGHDRG